MKEEILVPTIGESITEATVSKWLKNSGDKVIADEPIVELETDKVNLEVPSPVDGVLAEIKNKEGQSVQVGAILGIVLASTEEVSVNKDSEKKIIKPNEDKNEVEEIRKIIDELAGEEFNINSRKQLQVVLFENLGLKPGKKTKTGYSTNAQTLEKMKDDHPVINHLLISLPELDLQNSL